jgi:2-polyprenyl-6-methoxyphenol hydroxylase-like FAD-dependent oxidoreductase
VPSMAAIFCGPCPGGHGVAYYVPGPGQSTEPGERLLMWGYYLQVPESALASVLVDDQERQQSGSVPFGEVHPESRATMESRLAGLLPSPLFELVQQRSNSSIQAIYSCVPRSYVRNRLCLVGDSGALMLPFAGSGVLRAVTGAASLADALDGAPTVDDALRQWSDAQLQSAAQVIPNTEGIERATCSACQTSLPCPPRRPTTGCPQPIPGSRSPFPACDRKTAETEVLHHCRHTT